MSANVYFIQQGSDGPIKIGLAENVWRRRCKLQTGCGEILFLLTETPGSRQLERSLHRRFRHQRIRGEWFQPSDELMTLIAAYQAERNRRIDEAIAWLSRNAP